MVKLMSVAPEIPVADLAAAIEYYSARLGFRLYAQMPDGHYAVVERDEIALHLFDDGDSSAAAVSIHIFVDGLDELYAEFTTRGTTILQPIAAKPWGCRDFRVTDPTGNVIKFTEHSGSQ